MDRIRWVPLSVEDPSGRVGLISPRFGCVFHPIDSLTLPSSAGKHGAVCAVVVGGTDEHRFFEDVYLVTNALHAASPSSPSSSSSSSWMGVSREEEERRVVAEIQRCRERLAVLEHVDTSQEDHNEMHESTELLQTIVSLERRVQGGYVVAERCACSGDIPTAGFAYGSFVYGSFLYVFGGFGGNSECLSSMYALDLGSFVWQRVAVTGTQPSPRYLHSMTLVGSYAVVFGGQESDGNVSNETYIFHIGSRRWEKIREVDEQPSARCAHAACAWNSYLFIWGGRDRRSPLSDAWAFSIASKEWTHVHISLSPLSPTSPSQIPALCEHSAVTLLDGSILAFGGNNGSHRLSCVYLFRPRPSERGDAILDGCIVSIIDNDFSHHSEWPTSRSLSSMAFFSREPSFFYKKPSSSESSSHFGSVLVFGGYSGTRSFNDLYLLEVLDFRSHALSGDANSTNLQNAEYVSSPVREMSSLTMSVTKQSQPVVRYLYLRLDDGSVVKALRAELETHSLFFRNLSSTTETVIVSSTSRRVLEKFVQFLDGHVVSPDSFREALELVDIAYRFEVQSLKDFIVREFYQRQQPVMAAPFEGLNKTQGKPTVQPNGYEYLINTRTVCELFEVVDTLGGTMEQLRDVCLQFMARHFPVLSSTDAFQLLPMSLRQHIARLSSTTGEIPRFPSPERTSLPLPVSLPGLYPSSSPTPSRMSSVDGAILPAGRLMSTEAGSSFSSDSVRPLAMSPREREVPVSSFFSSLDTSAALNSPSRPLSAPRRRAPLPPSLQLTDSLLGEAAAPFTKPTLSPNVGPSIPARPKTRPPSRNDRSGSSLNHHGFGVGELSLSPHSSQMPLVEREKETSGVRAFSSPSSGHQNSLLSVAGSRMVPHSNSPYTGSYRPVSDGFESAELSPGRQNAMSASQNHTFELDRELKSFEADSHLIKQQIRAALPADIVSSSPASETASSQDQNLPPVDYTPISVLTETTQRLGALSRNASDAMKPPKKPTRPPPRRDSNTTDDPQVSSGSGLFSSRSAMLKYLEGLDKVALLKEINHERARIADENAKLRELLLIRAEFGSDSVPFLQYLSNHPPIAQLFLSLTEDKKRRSANIAVDIAGIEAELQALSEDRENFLEEVRKTTLQRIAEQEEVSRGIYRERELIEHQIHQEDFRLEKWNKVNSELFDFLDEEKLKLRRRWEDERVQWEQERRRLRMEIEIGKQRAKEEYEELLLKMQYKIQSMEAESSRLESFHSELVQKVERESERVQNLKRYAEACKIAGEEFRSNKFSGYFRNPESLDRLRVELLFDRDKSIDQCSHLNRENVDLESVIERLAREETSLEQELVEAGFDPEVLLSANGARLGSLIVAASLADDATAPPHPELSSSSHHRDVTPLHEVEGRPLGSETTMMLSSTKLLSGESQF